MNDRYDFPYRRCLLANYSTNGYPTIIPTVTPPTEGASTGVFFPSGKPEAVSSGLNQSPAFLGPVSINAAFFGIGAENLQN